MLRTLSALDRQRTALSKPRYPHIIRRTNVDECSVAHLPAHDDISLGNLLGRYTVQICNRCAFNSISSMLPAGRLMTSQAPLLNWAYYDELGLSL
jgi:hypothetical protein